MNTRPLLYAEDEEHDILFLKRACQTAGIKNPLIAVNNGQLAIEFLDQAMAQEPTKLPTLVLLDLNMPFKNGFDVLEWIRMQSCLCSLPVLILSSSDRISDIQAAYEKGVNGYLVKPASPKDLDAMIQALKGFWLTFNRTVPTNEAAIGQAAN